MSTPGLIIIVRAFDEKVVTDLSNAPKLAHDVPNDIRRGAHFKECWNLFFIIKLI